MRAGLPGLATPFAMAERLPSVLQEDDLLTRFTAGLDEVLAPVVATLDNLWAYFDAALCPPDFLDWLAAWVGVDLEDDQADDVRRGIVASAATWQRAHGTAAGVAEMVRRLTGGEVEVSDDGGTSWATAPTPPAAARTDAPRVHVVVRGAREVDGARVAAAVRGVVPAAVVVQVEVLPAGERGSR